MYISIARDREGHIRIYSNQKDVLYCTTALTANNVDTYLTLIMDAIMAWIDPIKVTQWEEVKPNTAHAPSTPRNAVGFNDTHREIWVLKYDTNGERRFKELLETGGRSVIATTFVITLSKLFLINLESTLEQQKGMIFEEPPKKKGMKNV
jgi:hypothetical protein